MVILCKVKLFYLLNVFSLIYSRLLKLSIILHILAKESSKDPASQDPSILLNYFILNIIYYYLFIYITLWTTHELCILIFIGKHQNILQWTS